MNPKRVTIVAAVLLAALALSLAAAHSALAQTAPPDTKLLSFPMKLGATATEDSTFGFASNPAGAAFECSLDGTVWAACTSPKNYAYAELALGSNTFYVRALASDGSPDATPASATWSVSPYEPWSKQVVRNITAFDGTSAQTSTIAFDSSGIPHAVFVNEMQVVYASWVPATKSWDLNPVPIQIPQDMGWETSLALDGQGHPHIAFWHVYTDGGLYYATWNGSAWTTTLVDPNPYPSGLHGWHNSLALDANGHPHISYYNADGNTPEGMYYAFFDGTNWALQQVDATCTTCGKYGTSLALDASGNPHIAYSGGTITDPNLKYAAWNGTAWDIQTIDSDGDTGYWPALALDGAGAPHISYHTGAELIYAVWNQNTGAWDRQVAAAGSVAKTQARTHLELDPSSHPHISYAAPGVLRYFFWDASAQAWQSEFFSGIYQWGSDGGSFALDPSGRAHFSVNGHPSWQVFVYEKAMAGKLRATLALSGQNDGSYPKDAQLEVCLSGGTIDVSGTTPNCKTATGHGGTVEWSGLMPGSDYTISAPDAADWTEPSGQGGLAVASRATTDVNLAFVYTGSAAPDTIITGRPLFDRVSRSDSPTFTFESSQTASTLQCRMDGAAWEACDAGAKSFAGLPGGSHTFEVAATNSRGQADDTPSVFTWTVDTGATWQQAVLPANAGSGAVAIVLDTAGKTHAAIASSDGGLRYAAWNGFSWDVEVVDSTAGSASVSFALDPDGIPQIAYSVSDQVKYARRSGAAWAIVNIAAGGPPALVIDAAGRPSIAFVDDVWSSIAGKWTYSLKYASQPFPGSWIVGTLGVEEYGLSYPYTPGPPLPRTPGLALDSDGHPRVAYFFSGVDYASGRVKYVAFDGTTWTTETFTGPDGFGGSGLSLALDAGGAPHVAFYSIEPIPQGAPALFTHLYHAHRSDAGWVIDPGPIDSYVADGGQDGWVSLAIDDAGSEHIGYFDGLTNRALMYGLNHGTGWSIQKVSDSTAGVWTGASMTLGANGAPHVTYPDAAAGAFKYVAGGPASAGGIQVTKQVTGAGYPAGAQFEICVSGGSIGETPECKTVTGNGGTATWTDLEPGSDYVVAEQDAGADWIEPAAQTVSVAANQTIAVTIDNVFHDATPPDTTITSGPAAQSGCSSASFEFTSDDSGATFECALDGAIFAACTSPQAYTGLTDASHNFEVRAKDASNNVDATPALYMWTVDRPVQTITFDAIAGKTYGDAAFAVSPTADSGLPVSLSAEGPCTVSADTVTITGAGSCTVTASQAGNENYEPATPVQQAFNISPAVLTAGITAQDRTYDGTTAATIVECSLSGVLPADLNAIACAAGEAAFDTADAGAGKTVTASVSLSGAAVGNYQLGANAATAAATIWPRSASVTPDSGSKTYGEDDPAFSGSLAGFVPADGVGAIYSRTPGEAVGGSYTISAALSPEAALGNYEITCNTAAFTIGQRPVQVTADAKSKFAGEADPALTYQITGGSLAFDDVFTGEMSRVPGEDVGIYPILQNTLALNGNYVLTYIGADLTIVSPSSAPLANPGGPYLGPVNTAIAFDGSGSYDAEGDPLTYAWTFSDGSTGTGAEPTHAYAAAGIYEVCLVANDGNLDSDPACTMAVVYDPSAGFVTGGGWINSPAGAYVADPALAGKATFGFVSKYKKGMTVPEGNTEFQFHAAGLNFKSTSYQWLVVAGANAKFKGVGTINGAGNYGFMLTATDGQVKGGGGIDRFRIKIWDKDDDAVVYDNEMGAADDSYAGDALGGGSIVIHAK